jgi:hypothetical protein
MLSIARSIRRPALQATRLRIPATQARSYLTLKDVKVCQAHT